jgi:cardiolipin synthase
MTVGNATINIPNILTITRILLVPLFVILLTKKAVPLALVVFAVMALSDFLDGFLARHFNQQSRLGAYLDPVADKLLMTASFVCMAILKLIPSWLTVIVISRDVIICVGMFVIVLTNSRYEMGPSRASKWTTALQLTTVFLALLAVELPWFAPVLRPPFSRGRGAHDLFRTALRLSGHEHPSGLRTRGRSARGRCAYGAEQELGKRNRKVAVR